MSLSEQWTAFLQGNQKQVGALAFTSEQVIPVAEIAARLNALRVLSFDEKLKNRFLIEPVLTGNESPDFLVNWFFSRQAVVGALEELVQKQIAPQEIQLSLSHTGNRRGIPRASVAVAIGAGQVAHVGVDLEFGEREISPAAAQKFVHDTELFLGWSALEIWVIKEACFKANPENVGTQISQYRIISKHEVRFGETKMEYQLVKTGPWIMAFAKK